MVFPRLAVQGGISNTWPEVSTLGAPRINAWIAAFAKWGTGICLEDHDRFRGGNFTWTAVFPV